MDIDMSATSGYCSAMSTFDNYNFNNPISVCDIVTNNNTETLTNCCLSPVLHDADCSIDTDDFNVTDNTINEKEQIAVNAKKNNFPKNSKIEKPLLNNHYTNMNDTDNLCNIPNNKDHHSNKRYLIFLFI